MASTSLPWSTFNLHIRFLPQVFEFHISSCCQCGILPFYSCRTSFKSETLRDIKFGKEVHVRNTVCMCMMCFFRWYGIFQKQYKNTLALLNTIHILINAQRNISKQGSHALLIYKSFAMISLEYSINLSAQIWKSLIVVLGTCANFKC